MVARTVINSFIILLGLMFFSSCMVTLADGAHFSYTPKDGNHPCIMMDAKFVIHINAVRYARTIASDIIDSEDQMVNTTGSCSNTTAILNLSFSGGRIAWSFIFRIDKKGVVTLDRLIQFIPKNIFAPFVTDISDPSTFADPNTIDLCLKSESYRCMTKEKTHYFPIKAIKGDTTFTIQTNIGHIKVQAFGIQNGRYSREALCHRDIANMTTSSPPTTTMTTTTDVVPAGAPDNAYYVSDPDNTTVCIALTGRIIIDIRYEYKTQEGATRKKTASFPVPHNATSKGNCKLSKWRQNIVIEFFDPSWSLELIFTDKKHSSNSTRADDSLLGNSQKKMEYRIENINLLYVNDHDKFPGSTSQDGISVRESSKEEESKYPHKSQGKGYFTCSADVKLNINKNAAINTEELYFKAFNNDKDYEFEGSPSECTADNNDDTLRVAIIISSVIGSITVIVVIIVVITVFNRRRRRRHYRPVRGNENSYDFLYH